MAFSFGINWNINKYRSEYESEEHWNLKAKFINAHKTRYVEEELICLAQVFCNIEFMNCRYPADTMALIEELSKDIAHAFRESRKNRLKRTFVTVSDAIKTKYKLIDDDSPLSVEANSQSYKDDCYNEQRQLRNIEANCDPIRLFLNEHPNLILFQRTENSCPVMMVRQNMKRNNISVKYEVSEMGGKWILLNHRRMLCGKNKAIVDAMLIKELKKHLYTIMKKVPFMACTKIIGIADLLKCSQIAEMAETDSSNSTFKLLQSLGWSSNPLARSNTDIEKSITVDSNVDQSNLGIQHYEKLDEQIVERLLIEYKMTNDLCDLIFSSKLRREDLDIIKSAAKRCELLISTYEKPGQINLVISNIRTIQELLASLKNTTDPLSNAKYKVTPPTRSSYNENIESKCRKSESVEYCDDEGEDLGEQPIKHVTASNFESKLHSNKDDDHNKDIDVDKNTMDDDAESGRLKNIEQNCDSIRIFVDEHPNFVLFQRKNNMCAVRMVREFEKHNYISVLFETLGPGRTWILLNRKRLLCGKNTTHACVMIIQELQKYFFTIKKKVKFMACTKIIGISDLLKCSQIAEIAEVDSSNSSFKLLQSLGWSSNRFARTNIKESITDKNVRHYAKLDPQIVESLLTEYKMSNDLGDLVFSTKLRQEDQTIIRSVAKRCNLIISTYGNPGQLVISNSREIQELLSTLQNTSDPLSNDMYEIIPPTRSSLNTESTGIKCIEREIVQYCHDDNNDIGEQSGIPKRQVLFWNGDAIIRFCKENPNIILFESAPNESPDEMVKNSMTKNKVLVKYETPYHRITWILFNGERMICGETKIDVSFLVLRELQKYFYTIKRNMMFLSRTKTIDKADERLFPPSTKVLNKKGLGPNNNGSGQFPIQCDIKNDRSGLGKMHTGKLNRRIVARLLNEYKMSNDLCDLIFSSEFTPDDRAIIVGVAKGCGLQTSYLGTKAKSQIIMSKRFTIQELFISLQNTTDPFIMKKYTLLKPNLLSSEIEN